MLEAEKPQLLLIPDEIIHGFECAGREECWILNLPTETYKREKPDEYRLPLSSPEVPYEPWRNKKGY
jgi:dTDP-4-dehydrorhamnose 3,5-epimerase-like enzyme